MAGKVYTVKPESSLINRPASHSSGYVKRLKPTVSKPTGQAERMEEENLKEVIIDYIEKGALLLLTLLFLVVSIFFAHKIYQYLIIKVEKNKLSQEYTYLTSEITRLTSREMLEEKAKKLGLRPPRENDIIRVR